MRGAGVRGCHVSHRAGDDRHELLAGLVAVGGVLARALVNTELSELGSQGRREVSGGIGSWMCA